MTRMHLSFMLLFFGNPAFSQPQTSESLPYTNGGQLVHAMYGRYAPDKWYRYFTFSQDVEFYRNDSVIKKEVWHEAYAPGKLVIKVDKKDSRKGVVYSGFTMHAFQEGQPAQKYPRVHELLLVGLDVYFFKPETTIRILDSLGYNLSLIREDVFKGRKVFVVGAGKEDLKSRQFWIDAERLYMHRIVYVSKGKVSDVVFGDYVKLKGNWIAKTIYFRSDGKLAMIERYFDIAFPRKLDPDYFNPEKFNSVTLE